MANKSNKSPESSSSNTDSPVWTELSKRTFAWGDDVKTISDQTVNALHYLIDMGAKQAYGDTSAAKGAFIGRLADGTTPKNAWVKKDRDDIATGMKISGYVDDNMAQRTALAEAYFAEKTAAKWKRIENGTLTVGGRGVRLSPDEQWLFDAAETDYLSRLAKQSPPAKIADKIAALKKADPEMTDESDANVRRVLVNKFLTANRTKLEKALEKDKAERAARASDDDVVMPEF